MARGNGRRSFGHVQIAPPILLLRNQCASHPSGQSLCIGREIYSRTSRCRHGRERIHLHLYTSGFRRLRQTVLELRRIRNLLALHSICANLDEAKIWSSISANVRRIMNETSAGARSNCRNPVVAVVGRSAAKQLVHCKNIQMKLQLTRLITTTNGGSARSCLMTLGSAHMVPSQLRVAKALP